MHREFVYCMKLILKEFMANKIMQIEKYHTIGQIKRTNSGP